MADISHRLMIKYGLRSAPQQSLQDLWTQRTESLIQQGFSAEDAGERAASQTFSDYNTYMYASEADTIASLLGRARDKD